MVKAGRFSTPAGTGNLAVTGVGFQPTWVYLVGVTNTADNTWQTGASKSITMGMFALNVGATMQQAVKKVVFDATDMASSSHAIDHVLELGSARANMGVSRIYAASAVSLDADGFTLNFSVAAAGYTVFYVASNDPAQAAFKRSIPPDPTGPFGMNLGTTPVGAYGIGISDTASATNGNWNGSPWTSLFTVGRVGDDGALGTDQFACWSPGYNSSQHYNHIQGAAINAGTWGAADDPNVFGTVVQGFYKAVVSGNDLTGTLHGAGFGTNMSVVVIGDLFAAGSQAVASASVGGVVNSTGFGFDPSWAMIIGGTGHGNAGDWAHTGAAIGCVTENGEMWMVACGTKMGAATRGPATYQTDQLAWMSGWEPYNNPTAKTDGTAAMIADGIRFTTSDNGHATRDVYFALFGPTAPSPETFIPQFFRVLP